VNKAIGLESKRKELGERKRKFQSHGQSTSNTRPRFGSQQSPSQYRSGGEGGRYPQSMQLQRSFKPWCFNPQTPRAPTPHHSHSNNGSAHLSETLLLFSLMGASSVESWDTMPTTVLREQCRLLRGTMVTDLGRHLHRLVLHRLLARVASRTMCVVGLIMYEWSKPKMTPAWYCLTQLYTRYSIV
jgi:hypothetical protein